MLTKYRVIIRQYDTGWQRQKFWRQSGKGWIRKRWLGERRNRKQRFVPFPSPHPPTPWHTMTTRPTPTTHSPVCQLAAGNPITRRTIIRINDKAFSGEWSALEDFQLVIVSTEKKDNSRYTHEKTKTEGLCLRSWSAIRRCRRAMQDVLCHVWYRCLMAYHCHTFRQCLTEVWMWVTVIAARHSTAD